MDALLPNRDLYHRYACRRLWRFAIMIAVSPTFAAVTARKAACYQVEKRSFSSVEMEELSSLARIRARWIRRIF